MMNASNNGGMSRAALMNKLSALGLAAHEAALYLDTHPNCREALAYFNEARDAMNNAACEYERRFGPLTAFSTDTENGWNWIKSPWPWESDSTKMC